MEDSITKEHVIRKGSDKGDQGTTKWGLHRNKRTKANASTFFMLCKEKFGKKKI